MNTDEPKLDHNAYSNYQWLIYACLIEDKPLFEKIKNNTYLEECVHKFFDKIEISEDGSVTSKDEKIKLVNNFFDDDDVYKRYVTNAQRNLYAIEDLTQDDSSFIDIIDYLYPNTIPFITILEPVMPLTEALLPDPFKRYILQSALNMDMASLDFTTIPIITCLAALLGNNVRIQPKVHADSWRLAANIWAAIIGSPSSKKTPSISHALYLLKHAIDTIISPKNNLLSNAYKVDINLYQAKKYQLKKDLSDATKNSDDTLARTISEEIATLVKPTLISRDFISNDATQEASALKLSQNENGILSMRDELSGWLESMNKQNQSSARAFYLEAFNGSKDFVVERITSDNYVIPVMLMSVLGGIQPSKLAPLLAERQNGQSDDGLLERLIQFSVYPDITSGQYTDQPTESGFDIQAKNIFKNAAKLYQPNGEPTILKYSEESQIIWDKWASNKLLALNAMTDGMQSIYGKQTATCAKLALIFHMIDELDKPDIDINCFNTSISAKSLNLAFKWIEYLDTHINRIVNFGSQDSEYNLARDLLARMPKLPDSFTVKTIADKGWAMFKKKDVRDKVLGLLVEHNYLQVEDDQSGTRVKRTYFKHPSLLT